MKDLIIGAADNYGWEHVEVWAKSVKQCGFSGDVVLLVYRVTPELIKNCEDLGIYVIEINHDEHGVQMNHTLGNINTQSHKIRNFHIWQFLVDNESYRMVGVTDTRDVYFQSNPSEFFDRHQGFDIYYPSEGIKIKDESWNLNMIKNLFGPIICSMVEENVVLNSGTVFGKAEAMKKLMLNMYMISKNFAATGADQPTMNVINSLFPLENCLILPMDTGWACQCATTMEPSRQHLRSKLLEEIPTVVDNLVVNSKNVPFVLVHQYDRNEKINKLIIENIT